MLAGRYDNCRNSGSYIEWKELKNQITLQKNICADYKTFSFLIQMLHHKSAIANIS